MVGKGPWTQQEDDLLKEHVNRQNGANAWGKVAEALGTRSAKQCRERWHQNLKPGLVHDPISEDEALFIVHMVKTRGKRWAEIARAMHGRSDNMIKNWWNGSNNRRERSNMDERKQNGAAHHQQYPLSAQQPLPEFSPRSAPVHPSPYSSYPTRQPQSAVEYRSPTFPSHSYLPPPPNVGQLQQHQPSRAAPTSSPSSPYYAQNAAARGYTAAPRPSFRHSDIPSLPHPEYEAGSSSALASPGASSVASSQQPPPSLAYSSRTPSAQPSPYASPDTPTAQYPELPVLPPIYDDVDRRDSKLPSSRHNSGSFNGSKDLRGAITSILNP